MLRIAGLGLFPFNSHPWIATRRRRFFHIHCDPRWVGHPLYALVCPCRRFWPLPSSIDAHEQILVGCGAPPHYLDALNVGSEARVPLVVEGYQEGMFAVERQLLLQRPQPAYSELVRRMEVETRGESHDAALQLWLYLFDERTGGRKQEAHRDAAAWHGSRSLLLYPGTFEGTYGASHETHIFSGSC